MAKEFTQIENENAAFKIHGYVFGKTETDFVKARIECVNALRRDLQAVESITFKKYQQLKRIKRF